MAIPHLGFLSIFSERGRRAFSSRLSMWKERSKTWSKMGGAGMEISKNRRVNPLNDKVQPDDRNMEFLLLCVFHRI